MTQCERVLRHLEDHGAITTYEAFREYGITRLPSRIHDLRGQGFSITSSYKTEKNRYGEKIHFMVYRLEGQA